MTDRCNVQGAHRTFRAAQGGIRNVAADDANADCAARLHRVHVIEILAQIHNDIHSNAMGMQFQTGFVSLGVGRDHRNAASGRNPIARHQPSRRRGQHHARKIIVTKHRRLLNDSCGEHHRAGAHLGQATRIAKRYPVIGVVATGFGRRQYRDAGATRQ